VSGWVLPWVRIFHGQRTGALRDAVQSRLASCRFISAFGFALPNLGGAGGLLNSSFPRPSEQLHGFIHSASIGQVSPIRERLRELKITEIEIRPMQDEGNLKAFCSIVFDDVFIVHSLKIIQGKDSLFVAMPCREVKSGQFRDTAHPIDNEFRLSMESLILDKYYSFMNRRER